MSGRIACTIGDDAWHELYKWAEKRKIFKKNETSFSGKSVPDVNKAAAQILRRYLKGLDIETGEKK